MIHARGASEQGMVISEGTQINKANNKCLESRGSSERDRAGDFFRDN